MENLYELSVGRTAWNLDKIQKHNDEKQNILVMLDILHYFKVFENWQSMYNTNCKVSDQFVVHPTRIPFQFKDRL